MKVVIQRVISAELLVDNKFCSKIGTGLVVLVAVSKHDTQEDINWIANKLVNLRIFSDQNNQMNFYDLQDSIFLKRLKLDSCKLSPKYEKLSNLEKIYDIL